MYIEYSRASVRKSTWRRGHLKIRRLLDGHFSRCLIKLVAATAQVKWRRAPFVHHNELVVGAARADALRVGTLAVRAAAAVGARAGLSHNRRLRTLLWRGRGQGLCAHLLLITCLGRRGPSVPSGRRRRRARHRHGLELLHSLERRLKLSAQVLCARLAAFSSRLQLVREVVHAPLQLLCTSAWGKAVKGNIWSSKKLLWVKW